VAKREVRKKAVRSSRNDLPEPCPTCASTDKVIPIVYGEPTSETWELVRAGRVALGGCVVTGDDPAWRCRSCGADFGRRSRWT